MAPEKQQKLEDVAGIKRQREAEEGSSTDGKGGKDDQATDGGKQKAPAEQPEPKHLKISDAPASVLEEGRIYFYYRCYSFSSSRPCCFLGSACSQVPYSPAQGHSTCT